MTKQTTLRRSTPAPLVQQVSHTRREALALLGPSLYAVWLPNLGAVKIGFSTNLYNRLKSITSDAGEPGTLLAVAPGATRADEQAIHDSLPDNDRARGREYYRPTPDVVAVVNTMRARTQLPPLDVHSHFS